MIITCVPGTGTNQLLSVPRNQDCVEKLRLILPDLSLNYNTFTGGTIKHNRVVVGSTNKGVNTEGTSEQDVIVFVTCAPIPYAEPIPGRQYIYLL